jgi:hypothetical protein
VYKFENLIPFKIFPLGLDAAIPAPLLMLEILSKIFNGKAERAASESLAALENVSSIRSGAGIAASSRRGSTWKGNKVTNLY